MKRSRLCALASCLPAVVRAGHCNDSSGIRLTSFIISHGCRHGNGNGNVGSHKAATATSILHAKRKDRRKSAAAGSSSKRKQRNSNGKTNINNDNASQTMETPVAVSNKATQRPPATLAGITEDHRYEQFFYNEQTANQLYQLVDLYRRPLLLCNPTLAVIAERKGKTYKLLDRDTRFDFLSGYEEFSLTEPHLISDYGDFDAVFVDPPFANVTPLQVARCLQLIGASDEDIPLWFAYNSRREEKLLETLNDELDCPDLVPKWNLGYKEGVGGEMQDSIWLYGPKS